MIYKSSHLATKHTGSVLIYSVQKVQKMTNGNLQNCALYLALHAWKYLEIKLYPPKLATHSSALEGCNLHEMILGREWYFFIGIRSKALVSAAHLSGAPSARSSGGERERERNFF